MNNEFGPLPDFLNSDSNLPKRRVRRSISASEVLELDEFRKSSGLPQSTMSTPEKPRPSSFAVGNRRRSLSGVIPGKSPNFLSKANLQRLEEEIAVEEKRNSINSESFDDHPEFDYDFGGDDKYSHDVNNNNSVAEVDKTIEKPKDFKFAVPKTLSSLSSKVSSLLTSPTSFIKRSLSSLGTPKRQNSKSIEVPSDKDQGPTDTISNVITVPDTSVTRSNETEKSSSTPVIPDEELPVLTSSTDSAIKSAEEHIQRMNEFLWETTSDTDIVSPSQARRKRKNPFGGHNTRRFNKHRRRTVVKKNDDLQLPKIGDISAIRAESGNGFWLAKVLGFSDNNEEMEVQWLDEVKSHENYYVILEWYDSVSVHAIVKSNVKLEPLKNIGLFMLTETEKPIIEHLL